MVHTMEYPRKTFDGIDCVDEVTNFNLGYCNLWHCYTGGCGPNGDSFYGQQNNWLTVSGYYFLTAGDYSITMACDDSCQSYFMHENGQSWQ